MPSASYRQYQGKTSEHWMVVSELIDTPEGPQERQYPTPVERDKPKAPAGGIVEVSGDGGWATVYRLIQPNEDQSKILTCAGVAPYGRYAPVAVYMLLGRDPRKQNFFGRHHESGN